jgi:hypothetical protein
MSDSPFERKLEEQKLRTVPSSWKAEILSRAAQELPARAKAQQHRSTPLADWVREMLWPSPLAWGALACLWIIPAIGGLNTDSSSFSSGKPLSPLERKLAREQREFVEEQFGAAGLPAGWILPKETGSREAPVEKHEGAFLPAMLHQTAHSPAKGTTHEA